MVKTKEELQEQANKIGLKRWDIHDCSMCGYQCGYVFESDNVGYDTGCDCSWGDIEPRTWDDLAEAYNRNQPENNPNIKQEYLDETNKVWQF